MCKQQIYDFLKENNMLYSQISFKQECQKFLLDMENGLAGKQSSLAMIPTYISVCDTIATNKTVLVIDAGGTNFRTCMVSFDADKKQCITDFSKYSMPGIERELSKDEFFNQIVAYTKDLASTVDDIGFCFSYPTTIYENKDGKLIYWTKEVKAPEVEGEFIGENLVSRLKAIDQKERNIVILNDTVATLLGGQGTTLQRQFDGYIGFIFGTGTNICYSEKIKEITKITLESSDAQMIVNVESGAYDKLPRGKMDLLLDETTLDKGAYQLEKMISGRYLGSVIFYCIKEALTKNIFSQEFATAFAGIDMIALIDANLFMINPYDKQNVLVNCCLHDEDRMALYYIIDAMITRAALLSAVKLCSLILKTGKGKNPCKPVAIVGEGTTFHKLKGYKEKLACYLDSYLIEENQIYYELIDGEDLNLIGTAIAALGN